MKRLFVLSLLLSAAGCGATGVAEKTELKATGVIEHNMSAIVRQAFAEGVMRGNTEIQAMNPDSASSATLVVAHMLATEVNYDPIISSARVIDRWLFILTSGQWPCQNNQ